MFFLKRSQTMEFQRLSYLCYLACMTCQRFDQFKIFRSSGNFCLAMKKRF